MNIQQALSLGTQKLQNLEHPKLEAEVILSHLTQLNRTQLKTKSKAPLRWNQQLRYRYALLKRARGLPVAYIFNQVEWNGLNLYVNRHTLIPRDETETLCQHIINNPSPCWGELEGDSGPKAILDIGTGSGCIALWLKIQYPAADTTALDISSKALTVAQHNARTLGQTITFKRSDLLSALPDGSHFDLIVANLPYVPDQMELSPEVQHEPRSAIVSGPEGLEHLHRLAQQLEQKSITFHQLWLEFLPQQEADINQIFSSYTVNFFPDVSGQIYFAQIKI